MEIQAEINEEVQQRNEPIVYRLILPNVVTTAMGDEVDIGQVEITTEETLNAQREGRLKEIDVIDQKLKAIQSIKKGK